MESLTLLLNVAWIKLADLPWGLFYNISEWVICLLMLIIVPSRRSPAAAKGWLLLTFFVPWVGLLAFWILGRPVMPRWRRALRRQLPSVLGGLTGRMQQVTDAAQVSPGQFRNGAAIAQRLSTLPPLHGNDLEILPDYDGTIERIIADIETATTHVHLLFYIFKDDATGRRVMAALVRAKRRGVSCRVLMDDIGSGRPGRKALKRLRRHGIDTHAILPVNPLLGLFKRRLIRADLRNHRKIVVIDGIVGYVGSQNIVDAKMNWRLTNQETMLRVTGPVVLQLQTVFAADWFLETEDRLEEADIFPQRSVDAAKTRGDAIAQVLVSGPDYPDVQVDDLLVTLLHNARKRVVMTTPYFVPTEAILQAMRLAVQRGVQVQLQVSKRMDTLLVRLAQRSYYAELLQAGVDVYLYQGKFLHAKHMTVDDDMALLGSSNIDIRSFQLNAEINLVIYDRATVRALHALEETRFGNSKKLLHANWSRRWLAVRMLENIARLTSPLL